MGVQCNFQYGKGCCLYFQQTSGVIVQCALYLFCFELSSFVVFLLVIRVVQFLCFFLLPPLNFVLLSFLRRTRRFSGGSKEKLGKGDALSCCIFIILAILFFFPLFS
ncbi:hypothetical protein U1Q18_021763 [Sarracenia purpurea var. burkii]